MGVIFGLIADTVKMLKRHKLSLILTSFNFIIVVKVIMVLMVFMVKRATL